MSKFVGFFVFMQYNSNMTCPYCKNEIDIEEVILQFKCKYHSDNMDDILGEPSTTFRHSSKCFPIGIVYNKKKKEFKVMK